MIAIFIFLTSKKIVLSSELVYQTDFQKEITFIHGPYPEGRVEQQGETVIIKHEPVYFEIYSPQKFSQAEVTIRYQKSDNISAKLGLQLSVSDWAFFMEDLPNSENNWIEKTFTYNLHSALITKNKIKFMLSAPNISQFPEGIKIDTIKFKFIK